MEDNRATADSEAILRNDIYASLHAALDAQERARGRRDIVFADINKTTERPGIDNVTMYATLHEFHLPFVNVTSRSLREVIAYINEAVIQPPHALAAKNGTRMYAIKPEALTKNPKTITEEDFSVDVAYNAQIRASGFDKPRLLNEAPDRLFQPLQDSFQGLKIDFQIEDRGDNRYTWGEKEDPYEMVCDIEILSSLPVEVPAQLLERVKELYPDNSHFLMHNGINQATQAAKFGLFILPKGVGKDTPIRYLMTSLNATGGVFAGDSENDAAAFFGDYGDFEKRFARIVVGGAAARLSAHINTLDEHKKRGSWRRLSVTGKPILLYEEQGGLLGPQSAEFAIRQALRIDRQLHGNSLTNNSDITKGGEQ